ncbi:hypothetical protein Ari01nite_93010 [Paractinoplanes rishiriensis]|uniref:Uncharacterized protein n=1 Tax=Paractinoplanes rishiriensis TaxID=1050105 RepID=A0A919K6H5_9ACTN|nr:hypothetical protein Ari01nite_93010 [Actinoplanes rishiriensis]
MHGPRTAHRHRHRLRQDTDESGEEVGKRGPREGNLAKIHEDAFGREGRNPGDNLAQRRLRVRVEITSHTDVHKPLLRRCRDYDGTTGC